MHTINSCREQVIDHLTFRRNAWVCPLWLAIPVDEWHFLSSPQRAELVFALTTHVWCVDLCPAGERGSGSRSDNCRLCPFCVYHGMFIVRIQFRRHESGERTRGKEKKGKSGPTIERELSNLRNVLARKKRRSQKGQQNERKQSRRNIHFDKSSSLPPTLSLPPLPASLFFFPFHILLLLSTISLHFA